MSTTEQPAKRKRTKVDRNLEHRTTLEQTIGSIWQEAARRGESHQWILDQITKRVYESPRHKKLTNLDKAYLRGISMAWLNAAQAWRLFGVWRVNGVAWINDWDTLPEHVKEEIRQDRVKYESAWLPPAPFADRPSNEAKGF